MDINMLFVTKRDGHKESVHFDKITERINKLVNPVELQSIDLPYLTISKESEYLDPVLVAQKVVASLYSGITTEELDIESAEICVNLSTKHPSYSYLGGRILISNLHKKTLGTFSDKMQLLYQSTNTINKDWLDWVMSNSDQLNQIIDYNRDYLYDYFGFKTLEKSYLLKSNGKIQEKPQDMLMRVAATLQQGNLELIKKTYDYMSLGYYTHASPTMFNSGTNYMQLSSCFLLGTNDDLTDITTTWNSCAQISKWSGGIGLHVGNIRGKDSLIKGTNGRSNGLVPFLKVFNDIARWIDQGGRRPGSIAIYLEPHHPDIFEFLDLRKNFGSETERARDLFLALWISDLFMKQVEADGDWYLLSADECPGLTDTYGDAYEQLYWKYVNECKHRKVIKARKLWIAILEAQIETGMPYVSYKDAVNIKSNQKNLGTIKSSNLCNEINQYSDHKEYAVCNLASISLKAFVKPWIPSPDTKWIIYTKPNCKYCSYAKSYLTNNQIDFIDIPFNNDTLIELKQKLNSVKITFPQIFVETNGISKHIGGWSDLYKFTSAIFDYDKLYDVAYLATINLNQVIDINYYPVPQTKYSNMRHRPIGLGIQGLADALVMMRIPFDSDEAVKFNEKYMETIYLAAMTASNDMSIKRSNPMSILISYLNETQFNYPEYYSPDYIFPNHDINKLYHDLKPNKWELLRNPNLSTIGSYSSFDGSPLSQGKFQFDLWEKQPEQIEKWNKLRESIIKYGTRNSLLTALMPTASTSQILGNNECFEFFTNNIYTRKTHAGNFILVNKYLVNDLIRVNLWSSELKDRIIASNGSIQTIDEIPPEFKQIYKTMWEIKQIWVLKGAVARGPFVDQTQSMNIFMAEPDYQRLGSSHFWAWKNGLKTGLYYLRTKPAADAIKFTVDPKLAKMSIDPGSIKKTIKLVSPTSSRSIGNTLSPEENSDFSFGGCENCSA
jgi:ribonucleoside-diphosphate reductase alpha subunit